jgi:hypothetical protein
MWLVCFVPQLRPLDCSLWERNDLPAPQVISGPRAKGAKAAWSFFGHLQPALHKVCSGPPSSQPASRSAVNSRADTAETGTCHEPCCEWARLPFAPRQILEVCHSCLSQELQWCV